MKGGLVVFSIDHSLTAFEGRKVSTEVVVDVTLKLHIFLFPPFFLGAGLIFCMNVGIGACMYMHIYFVMSVDSHIL